MGRLYACVRWTIGALVEIFTMVLSLGKCRQYELKAMMILVRHIFAHLEVLRLLLRAVLLLDVVGWWWVDRR